MATRATTRPSYYLETDAPLYYYSFTDAYIAMQYRSLPKDVQARFDPMITGFNPADMYAADHIRRVLAVFPGVFSGIGEFSIHKEFVSSKVAGEVASLTNPALDSILSFAGEAGLVVLIHNDLDRPFAKAGEEPIYLTQMKALLGGIRRRRSSGRTWASDASCIQRSTRGPATPGAPERDPEQVVIVESILRDPAYKNVYFDISWDEVAKYIVATPAPSRRPPT